MSKLEKLFGKGKKINIGEIELEIKPLTVSSLPFLMKIGDETDKEGQAEAMKQVLILTLKDAVPEATEEEINKISLEYLTQLMKEIMEINQLEGTVNEKEFIEKLKKMKK